MKLVIDIPDEFTRHFNQDRFQDSLGRLGADAHLLAGNYERELALMLIKAFKNSTPLPKGHGRLIDVTRIGSSSFKLHEILSKAPTIIEADKEVEE